MRVISVKSIIKTGIGYGGRDRSDDSELYMSILVRRYVMNLLHENKKRYGDV